MASCLLNFLVWFGFANIATLHSSLPHIGSKAKSSVWYSSTSSFVTVVTCKLGNSDCIPRKSVFGINLPQKPQQSKKKSRHCGDDSRATRVVEASEGYVVIPVKISEPPATETIHQAIGHPRNSTPTAEQRLCR